MWLTRPPDPHEAHTHICANRGHQLAVSSAVLFLYAGDWGLWNGVPDHMRPFGSLRTEVACLFAAAALTLCAGLATLKLQQLAPHRDRLELKRQVVIGRVGPQRVVRGGLAVVGKPSARLLAVWQWAYLLVFVLGIWRLISTGRCPEAGLPLFMVLYMAGLAVLKMDREGWGETWIAPLLYIALKLLASIRDPSSCDTTCLGFMDRSSLASAALHGVHVPFSMALCSPGLPEYAQPSVAAYVALGGVEHWLRHWDAVAAHRVLVAGQRTGLLPGVLLGNGDLLSLWEGAVLSLLVYLTAGVVASGAFLYGLNSLEQALVLQALKDSDSQPLPQPPSPAGGDPMSRVDSAGVLRQLSGR